MDQLICGKCGSAFPLCDPRWRCDCGYLLDVEFAPVFALDKIAERKPTMWRYREAIPISDDANVVTLDEGYTPLLRVSFDGVPIWMKQDHLFPTGSYKDRGASVLMSKAKELGIQRVVEDSSGNAGCAVAAYSAVAGIECAIYVPEHTAAAKLAQIRRYGATLNLVPGERQDTALAALEAAQGTYYASHSWNPFFLHGTKTFAFEVCEQLGWRSPDTVILPVGNGTLLLGAYLGFTELMGAGIVSSVPKLIAVQAEACAPLAAAFRGKLDSLPEIPARDTLAEGIAITSPIRGGQILRAVRDSGGHFVSVSEGEIKASLTQMCRKGFYIEPTSAAATAGVSKYVRRLQSDEVIVSVLTGHGLKATEKMLAI